MAHHFDEGRARWMLREVLPHEPALRAWLKRQCAAGLEPEDVIQEAYSLLAARDRVDDIRHPKAYLFQTARSLVAAHVRRARIVPFQALEELDDGDLFEDGPSPERIVSDRDALRRLAQAIAALPPQAQRALILRRVHDLSQQEIARRMGLSENTVEKHIARGASLKAPRSRPFQSSHVRPRFRWWRPPGILKACEPRLSAGIWTCARLWRV